MPTDADPQRTAARLSVELEARLLQRLSVEWRGINYSLFKSALRAPVIGLCDADEPLARFIPELRSVELSRGLVLAFAWAEVLESLKRLAVQQFIHERLSVDEHPRGPTYRRICGKLGVDPLPTSASRPVHVQHEPQASARVVSRVHKLLALARSPNRHEAETAAMTAQRLLLKFNIQHDALDDPSPGARYTVRHLGPPLARRCEHDQRLAKILNDYFFVESAWLPIYLPRQGVRATVLEICGLDVNLQMAEHVHAFLRHTASSLWSTYQRTNASSSTDARLAFLAGVMQGFESKLAEQKHALAEQGLVWVPGPGLVDFFARRNPGLRRVHGEAGHFGDAYDQGHHAGRSITLSTPLGSSSGSSGVIHALGTGSARG
jgi:hypothetical protein